MFTDGSKNKQECVGIGIHIPECNIDISKRISDQLLSVYMAEIVAVIIALQWVEEVKPDRVTVCTDSDTVNDICQRRLNDRSLSQFVKNS